MENNNDLFDLFDAIETSSIEKESSPLLNIADDEICIPLHYQIFSTSNNTSKGHKEVVDTYACDRKKGIVPTMRAKGKADGMKQVYPNKVFFVMGYYEIIYANSKGTKKFTEIIYHTK
jgi:hypothetical protein